MRPARFVSIAWLLLLLFLSFFDLGGTSLYAGLSMGFAQFGQEGKVGVMDCGKGREGEWVYILDGMSQSRK